MRIISLFIRSLKQEMRDPLTTILALFTTPFFIFFYWMILENTNPIRIGIYLPNEKIAFISPNFADELMKELRIIASESNNTIDIAIFHSKEEFIEKTKSDSDMILIAPNLDQVTQDLMQLQLDIKINSKSEKDRLLALEIKSKLCDLILNPTHVRVNLIDKGIRQDDQVSQFDAFVPGFLVFSIIMIVFSTSMMLTSEIESGVFMRYAISKTPAIQYLLGLGFLQFSNSAISILLSILLTKLLGFDFKENLLSTITICLLGSFSAIGIGMLIASLLNTMNQAFLASSFVMFLLLLFSGIIFPKPNLTFNIGQSFQIEIFSFLPTAQLKLILDSILFQNKSLSDNASNLIFLLSSSLFFLMFGTFFYRNLLIKGSKEQ